MGPAPDGDHAGRDHGHLTGAEQHHRAGYRAGFDLTS
jgi:hypothetical protein